MKLFEKCRIGTMELKNRLVGAATNDRLADSAGYVTQAVCEHFGRRAKGGVGLVIVADGGVDTFHVNSHTQLRVSDDSYIPGLTRLAAAIKDNGARAAIQLQHAGWRTARSWGLTQAVGPTALTSRERGEGTREMTVAEIKGLIRQHAKGALRVKQAGFDAAEIHAGHGYLLGLFLSPYTNWRQDDYGGDMRRRARLVLEIVAAIRREVGRDYPLIVRISADELVEGGLTLRETRVLSRWLEGAGVDCISVSAGTEGHGATLSMLTPRGSLVPLATAIKEEVKVPVIAVGRIDTPALAENILQQGKADLIAVARPLLADPDWPKKAMEGREREIRKCLYCDGCRRDPPPEGMPIMCIVNPEIGMEGVTEAEAPQVKRVVVIGGGPAGLEAARVARLRGHHVTLWDEATALGGRWSWLIRGCITERVKVLKGLGVQMKLGQPITAPAVAGMRPDVVLVTPRAVNVPLSIPVAEGENVLLADRVLDGRLQVPGKVVVIGAGNVGCEVAYLLSRQGTAVIVVEGEEKVGYGLGPTVAKALMEKLGQRGVQFRTGLTMRGIQEGRVLCQDRQGRGSAIEANAFVIAQPAQPSEEPAAELGNLGLEVHVLPYCGAPGLAARAIRMGASIARQV